MRYTWLKIIWALFNLMAYPSLFLFAYHRHLSVTITVIMVSIFFLLSNACFIAIVYYQYKKSPRLSENDSVDA